MPGLTISGMARAAGVNVETVRFYQRKGLVPEPSRLHGTIRRYGQGEVERVRFIKAAQRLGFTLAEVGLLLRLEDGTDCAQAKRIAELKLEKVRERVRDLRRMETELSKLARACARQKGQVCCPLISALRHTR